MPVPKNKSNSGFTPTPTLEKAKLVWGFTSPSTVRKAKLVWGFTLVELLVVISIFVILTGVVLFNQEKFNSTILLTNLAYDTALTIRQAQTYGINIKEFDADGKFFPYGVSFKTSDPKSFILFADLNEDGKFPVSTCQITATDGCVQQYTIKRGNSIKGLCSNVEGDCDFLDSLDITFKRPNPDAIIIANSTTGNPLPVARIILQGVDTEAIREVIVQKNGLIYVKSR